MAKQWKVQVLEGWMLGIQSFPTHAEALEFYDKWLQVAVNEGDLAAHSKIKWLGAVSTTPALMPELTAHRKLG